MFNSWECGAPAGSWHPGGWSWGWFRFSRRRFRAWTQLALHWLCEETKGMTEPKLWRRVWNFVDGFSTRDLSTDSSCYPSTGHNCLWMVSTRIDRAALDIRLESIEIITYFATLLCTFNLSPSPKSFQCFVHQANQKQAVHKTYTDTSCTEWNRDKLIRHNEEKATWTKNGMNAQDTS